MCKHKNEAVELFGVYLFITTYYYNFIIIIFSFSPLNARAQRAAMRWIFIIYFVVYSLHCRCIAIRTFHGFHCVCRARASVCVMSHAHNPSPSSAKIYRIYNTRIRVLLFRRTLHDSQEDPMWWEMRIHQNLWIRLGSQRASTTYQRDGMCIAQ